MTTQTILPVDSEALRALSEGRNEPAWLSEGAKRHLILRAALRFQNWKKQKLNAGIYPRTDNTKQAMRFR